MPRRLNDLESLIYGKEFEIWKTKTSQRLSWPPEVRRERAVSILEGKEVPLLNEIDLWFEQVKSKND